MFRLTIKNVVANKIRFALTTFGVILAVSFVVAAFVLGDGLRSSFTDVSQEITAGIDLEVRNVADFGETPPLPADTVATVRQVDGVADAVAEIEAADDAVRPIPPDGQPITTDGPPQLAFNWIDNEQLSAFRLVDGTAPDVGEFTIDVDSADEYGFVIGDTYEVMIPDGSVDLRLSGTTSFGADNATLGAVLMQMNTAEASRLFGIDGIDDVAVQVADGADVAAVQTAVAAAVSATVPAAEVVDHATILDETTRQFTDEIDVVGNILLGFGAVALFVSMFIIHNTFAIVMGQRTRELALLRTVGAAPAQIRRAVLGEALLMGVLAAAGGIGAGVLVAKGIDALFGVMGVDLVDYPFVLATRTLVAAAVIGIGVTLVAANGPARRAGRVAPVALLGADADSAGAGSRGRRVGGAVLVGAGVAVGAIGLAGAGSTTTTVAALAAGTAAVFLGVTMLSPLAVGAVTSIFGWPMRLVGGVSGRMAQRNAARNPRRTASTGAALMIGLTMVTTAFVIGESVKATVGSAFEHSARADYYLSDDLEEVQFPASLAPELRQLDAVAAATGFTQTKARIDASVTDVAAFDFDQIDQVLDLGVTAGRFDGSVDDPVVVSADTAAADGIGVGDALPLEFADGAHVVGTVVGIFDDQSVLTEDYLLDTSVLADAGVEPAPEWVAVTLADGATEAQVATLVDDLSARFPYAAVETASQFRHRIEGMVDAVLTMVNVMVALAVIIALIGIANTLALSVFERTRELGLVRAVGMTRRQVRRMVRFEAALVAVFGATLGAGLGVLFGLAVASALPPSIAATTVVPAVPIVAVAAVATLAAVGAAWLPARRAGRLDVLQAIAH
jgi:putative ABC transport system permease protein